LELKKGAIMITYKHLRHNGKLYATRCKIQDGEFDPVAIGFAICADQDNFCRKIGRDLAFKRAAIALITKRNTLPIRRNTKNTNAAVYYSGFQPKFKSIYWTMEPKIQENTSIVKEGKDCTHYVHSIIKKEAPKEKEGKLDWSCLPLTELQEVVKVFEFGKKKYGKAFTYRQSNGVPKEDLFAAIMRHLERIQSGEEIAKDSKCLHVAHVIANCLMYISTLGKTK
jgi:hypothetical protein